jgi:hypothetical protein
LTLPSSSVMVATASLSSYFTVSAINSDVT